MKRFIFQRLQTLTVCSLLLALPICVSAQDVGGGTGGSGGTGNGGTGSGTGGSTGSGSTGSSSTSGTVTAPDTGMSLETTNLPGFSGFRPLDSSGFVGIDLSAPFVGVDPQPNRSGSTTSSSANSRTRTTTSRRTTSSRTNSNRLTTGRSSSSTSGRWVRAAATTDFELPTSLGDPTAALQSRVSRLANLQNSGMTIESTPSGTVATLTGTVATPKERKLAQQLLLLEPGIDKVNNELVVSPGQ